MKRLHRYFLAELLQNASLMIVAILAIFFMVALALVLGTSRTEGVPFELVMRHTGFKAVSTLYLTLPLMVLAACIFTYGRARADGEFTALRTAGIHPWQVLVPALVLGALCTLMLCYLQGGAMPKAHFRGKIELKQDLLDNLEGLLKRKDKRIEEDSWSASWDSLRRDDDGHLVLGGLQLILFDKEGNLASSLRARWAKPTLDAVERRLHLTLDDLVRRNAAGEAVQASTFQLSLNLDSFGGGRSNKRESDCTYEELLSRSDQYARRAAFMEEGKARSKLMKKSREYLAEYHLRVAFSFSAILFSFLGAAIGLWRGSDNRAVVFMIGFLIVVGLYYPLQMAGMWLAVDAELQPGVALWIGNGVIFFLSSFVLRRVLVP